MPCYHPIQGFRARTANPSGKYSIVFNPRLGYIDLPVTVPCGQCIGCRLERSRQWAIRCVHEASMHEKNCFITLTYSPKELPKNGSLVLEDFQNFMKKLRKQYGPGIRFFHCGEYGEENARPHYHACIFGLDFKETIETVGKDGKKCIEYLYEEVEGRNGQKYYVSKSLSKLWDKGIHRIGDLTFESAAYVARYVTKKVTGPSAKEHYQSLNLETGVISEIKPEYVTMSRRPGIGKGWFEKYHSDVYPDDFVVIRGIPVKPPKYYDKQYEILDSDLHHDIKLQRRLNNKKYESNQTPERLEVREALQNERFKILKRGLENDS